MSILKNNLEIIDKAATTCCGGPAPAGDPSCCIKDAEAKEKGKDGCGCNNRLTADLYPSDQCCNPKGGKVPAES